MPGVVGLGIGLIVIAGDADEEIGKIRTGFRTGEEKRAVESGVRVDVDLLEAQLNAGFQRMRADHLGEIIGPAVGVVGLGQVGNGSPDHKRIENHVLHAFDRRSQRHDARSTRARHESLRGEARTYTARRLSHVIGVAHVAEAKLIHSRRAEDLRIAEVDQLRAAQIQCAETGDTRSALSRGIGIV